ncbi:hypothetical protein [Winogradskyella immobilis]|uniref:Uncharacterized protein n=1 Tax=Winogradskyella immobilis TaxID=2816852 RepID=A0ABS8EPQ1_9FLAO|nr:hypothetical protein [Winogradskyella immobilis]MCC1485199.1 hypothetical protein [Winogradskyella immobilis]MCG0017291.1 hypothetical protein [Winogradskyella immobilis]
MFLDNYLYYFYPRGIIDAYSEAYRESREYRYLKNKIKFASESWDIMPLFHELSDLITNLKIQNCYLVDVTNFSFNDRCFNFQYRFEDSNSMIIKSICCNLSILFPTYCIYYIERDYSNIEIGVKTDEKFFNNHFSFFPAEYNYLRKEIDLILKSKGLFKIINEDLDKIIPKIAFDIIKFDKMSMFNCLFLNEPYITPKLNK